jgi:hypothetical protein
MSSSPAGAVSSVGFAGRGRLPGQLHNRLQKSKRVNINPLIKFYVTRTVPAAKTKSIGLQADARVVMVFAMPPGQLYRDMTNPAYLSGTRHLDSFIVTPNARPHIGTLQKRTPTLTQSATQLNRRAVRFHSFRKIRLLPFR